MDKKTTIITAGNTAGFTQFVPSSDTRQIFVDSSAPDDSANGLTSGTPKKTLAAGVALLRDGFPDWLLLKKGGVWTDQAIDLLTVSGRSASEPMLISSYGTGARPLVQPKAGTNNCFIGAASAGKGDYVAVVGIEAYAYTRDPGNGAYDSGQSSQQFPLASWSSGINSLWFEDCKLSFGSQNIDVNNDAVLGGLVTIRRCILTDAYDTGHDSAGLFISGAGFFIEETLFDHNGWNETVTTDDTHRVRSRNVYLQANCTAGSIFQKNVSARSSSEGAQIRFNARVSNNLFLHNPIGYQLGATSLQTTDAQLTDDMLSENNVTLEACDVSADTHDGQGLNVYNCSGAGVIIRGDIFANPFGPSVINQQAVTLHQDAAPSDVAGITIQDIIIFKSAAGISDQSTGTNNISGTKEDLNGDNAEFSFSAPTLSAASYAGTLGLTSSLDGLLNAMRDNSKDNWNANLTSPAFNNYIRAGFDKAAV